MGDTHNRTYDWADLRRRFLHGEWKNLKVMGEALNIPKPTLSHRASSEDWWLKRREIEARTEAKVEEKIATVTASRYAEIIEKHLQYSDVLIALGFKNFEGKQKITRETDALSAIRLGLETQRRAVRGFEGGDEDMSQSATGPIFNQQVNIYAGLDTQVQISQVAETLKILADAHVIPKPGRNGDGPDGK